VENNFLPSPQLVEVISSMKNLEKLDLDFNLTLEVLACVFQSCSKLVELHITTDGCEMLEMAEHLKDQLRSVFQKLRCLNLVCFIDNGSWPVIPKMLT